MDDAPNMKPICFDSGHIMSVGGWAGEERAAKCLLLILQLDLDGNHLE